MNSFAKLPKFSAAQLQKNKFCQYLPEIVIREVIHDFSLIKKCFVAAQWILAGFDEDVLERVGGVGLQGCGGCSRCTEALARVVDERVVKRHLSHGGGKE